jgi:hypothetical protein
VKERKKERVREEKKRKEKKERKSIPSALLFKLPVRVHAVITGCLL